MNYNSFDGSILIDDEDVKNIPIQTQYGIIYLRDIAEERKEESVKVEKDDY